VLHPPKCIYIYRDIQKREGGPNQTLSMRDIQKEESHWIGPKISMRQKGCQ
jgi:hypothetical protein